MKGQNCKWSGIKVRHPFKMNTFDKGKKRKEPTFQRACEEDRIEAEGLYLWQLQLRFGGALN